MRDPGVPGLRGGKVKEKSSPRLGGQMEISSRERRRSCGLCSPWAARGRSVTCMNPPERGCRVHRKLRGPLGELSTHPSKTTCSLCPQRSVPQRMVFRPPGTLAEVRLPGALHSPSLSTPSTQRQAEQPAKRSEDEGMMVLTVPSAWLDIALPLSPPSSPPRRGMLIILTQQVLKLRL